MAASPWDSLLYYAAVGAVEKVPVQLKLLQEKESQLNVPSHLTGFATPPLIAFALSVVSTDTSFICSSSFILLSAVFRFLFLILVKLKM